MMTTLDEVRHLDATVRQCLDCGKSYEDVIIELANQKAMLWKRVMELEAIAPRKIRSSDGRVFIYHCPDQFIPEYKANAQQS